LAWTDDNILKYCRDVENFVDLRLNEKGIKKTIGGSLSSEGEMKINESWSDPISNLKKEHTKIHENIHLKTQQYGVKKYSVGTKEFNKYWCDPKIGRKTK